MTERQALVKAMLAEPDDDLPRLVFADWLDENGDPDRAEFTRLQVEAGRLTGEGGHRLLMQAGQLLGRHWEQWVGPLYPLVWDDGMTLYHLFRRGMLTYLAVREDEFIRPQVQEQLAGWAADNGIERLVLHRDESVRSSWSRLGMLAGVLVNTLRGKYAAGERPVLEVAASPVLASVAALDVTGPTADDQCLRVLADSPHVGLLSTLILNDPHCTDAGLDALSRAHHLQNLRALNLNVNGRVRFKADWVLKVLASDRLPKFTSLGLGGNWPAGFDLARILHHPAAGRLTSLRLETADALRVVAQSRYLTRLGSLELTGRQVVLTSEGVNALLTNPALAGLQTLRIWLMYDGNFRITQDDVARLRARFGPDIGIGG
jgi:uncharacterized protein (TIGR02996 family)